MEIEIVTTNTWTNAIVHKPPIGVEVLAKFSDGFMTVAKWNGLYWVGQYGMRFMRTSDIQRFYIFDKDTEDDE